MSNQKWSVDRLLCLLQNHENGLRTHLKNGGKEEIKGVSKYKLRRAIFEEFNKL